MLAAPTIILHSQKSTKIIFPILRVSGEKRELLHNGILLFIVAVHWQKLALIHDHQIKITYMQGIS